MIEDSTMLSPLTLLQTIKLPTQLPAELLAFTLLIAFAMLSTLEFYAPRDKLPSWPLRRSYLTNISLFVVNSCIVSVLSASSLLALAERYSHHNVLNNYLPSPAWQAALAFLLLDLSLYVWHRAAHHFEWLWLFHKVHHNDPYLNISTSFRIHIGELLGTYAIKALLIMALGIKASVIISCEAVLTFFILFHHTNIRFKGERWLSYFVIVPALHRTHHSTLRAEHDSNYGTVLSLWDRLFGTYKDCHAAHIGSSYASPQTLIPLLAFGFYTPTPLIETPCLEAMIAEAAYYKAERRGFSPGNEIRDWLEAKREILALVYADKSLRNKFSQHQQGGYFKFKHPLLPIQHF